jgi:hypothetical protein
LRPGYISRLNHCPVCLYELPNREKRKTTSFYDEKTIDWFPEGFMFERTPQELENWRLQFATFSFFDIAI